MNTYPTREAWLRAAVDYLRPRYAAHGELPTPDKLHVIISWPKGRGKNRIGECFPETWTENGSVYVTVSPIVREPVRVLDILVHELIHALGIRKHGKDFKKVALALGLEGKMTATTAGATLANELQQLAEELGPYPHEALVVPAKPEKETEGRKVRVKLRCPDHAPAAAIDYVVEITPKRLAEFGPPKCPFTDEPMVQVD